MPTETKTAYDDLSIAELRSRGSRKWSQCGPDVLAAWLAEMDYPLAPAIRQALIDAVHRDFTGYPPFDADSDLPQACADWMVQRWSWTVDAKRIHSLPDIIRGIELALLAFSPPASDVVLSTPAYPPFFEIVGVAGHPIVEVPAVDEGGVYRLDLDGIDRALAGGARTFLLCNPYNPLGRVFTANEMNALAEVVDRRGARVIADEVHAPLTYPGARFTPYASVSGAAASHSVTLTSASKAWNLPGLKCAQVVLTNDADEKTWSRLSRFQTHGASTFGIAANIAAYRYGSEWVDETVAYLDANRRLLGELLSEHLPMVRYRPPEATYLAWLDCRELNLADAVATFLERGHVVLTDGKAFGEPGHGYVRLNFATSRTILEQIVQRMARAVR